MLYLYLMVIFVFLFRNIYVSIRSQGSGLSFFRIHPPGPCGQWRWMVVGATAPFLLFWRYLIVFRVLLFVAEHGDEKDYKSDEYNYFYSDHGNCCFTIIDSQSLSLSHHVQGKGGHFSESEL